MISNVSLAFIQKEFLLLFKITKMQHSTLLSVALTMFCSVASDDMGKLYKETVTG